MKNETTTVEERVIQKIKLRRIEGLKKYGTSMERTDLSRLDWLIHAQQEMMDGAIYLEKLIAEETGCDCSLRTKLVGDGCEKCNPDIMQKVKAASRAAAERAEAHPETASRDLEYERHPERCS